MTNKFILGVSSVVVGLILIIALVSSYISITNQEVRLYKLYEAKQKNIENVYDEVWKTIAQKAQISEDYRDSFDSIYTHIMSNRYDKGDGTLMKWIKESNPQFETTLYMDLSQSIDSKRSLFRNEQTELLDVVREYNTFISVFPNKIFLSKEEIKPKLITSGRTNNAIETGEDNDINLF